MKVKTVTEKYDSEGKLIERITEEREQDDRLYVPAQPLVWPSRDTTNPWMPGQQQFWY